MALAQILGLWLSLTTVGTEAEKPVSYTSDASLIFYLATDSGTLYYALRETFEDAGDWTPVVSADLTGLYDATLETLILPNIPTDDPLVDGAVWSDEGVLTMSAGA